MPHAVTDIIDLTCSDDEDGDNNGSHSLKRPRIMRNDDNDAPVPDPVWLARTRYSKKARTARKTTGFGPGPLPPLPANVPPLSTIIPSLRANAPVPLNLLRANAPVPLDLSSPSSHPNVPEPILSAALSDMSICSPIQSPQAIQCHTPQVPLGSDTVALQRLERPSSARPNPSMETVNTKAGLDQSSSDHIEPGSTSVIPVRLDLTSSARRPSSARLNSARPNQSSSDHDEPAAASTSAILVRLDPTPSAGRPSSARPNQSSSDHVEPAAASTSAIPVRLESDSSARLDPTSSARRPSSARPNSARPTSSIRDNWPKPGHTSHLIPNLPLEPLPTTLPAWIIVCPPVQPARRLSASEMMKKLAAYHIKKGWEPPSSFRSAMGFTGDNPHMYPASMFDSGSAFHDVGSEANKVFPISDLGKGTKLPVTIALVPTQKPKRPTCFEFNGMQRRIAKLNRGKQERTIGRRNE